MPVKHGSEPDTPLAQLWVESRHYVRRSLAPCSIALVRRRELGVDQPAASARVPRNMEASPEILLTPPLQ